MDLPVEVGLRNKVCMWLQNFFAAWGSSQDYGLQSESLSQLDKIPYYSEESNMQRLSQK